MSAPRLARANRSRFFIGLGILILTVGFVAMFHSNNNQHQLDELRQLEHRCQQQQDTLNQQIIIVEKSVKSERLEHKQTKIELQSRFNELKEFREKAMLESNHKFAALELNYTLLKSQHDESILKFGALQQNYKLLKASNDDLTEEFHHLQANRSDMLVKLAEEHRNATKTITLQLKQRNAEVEELRITNQILQDKNEQLQQNGASNLQVELIQYREHCAWRPIESPSGPIAFKPVPDQDQISNNFNVQIPVSDNLFRINLSNSSGTSAQDSTTKSQWLDTQNVVPGSADSHFAGQPRLVTAQPLVSRSAQSLIINSVENFQIIPKALMASSVAGVKANQSSTPSSAAKAAELENAPLPTAERLSSLATKSRSTTKAFVRPVPEGVVAVPPNEMILEERVPDEAKTEAPLAIAADQTNNRYANVVDEAKAPDVPAEEEPKAIGGDAVGDLPAVSEVDNGAREVLDNNEFLVDGHKDHLQAVLDDVKLSGNNNNAAEVDANGFDGAVQRQRNVDEQDDQNDVDNAILSGVGVGNVGGDLIANRVGHNSKLFKDPKLMREIDADDGKVAGYPDDMHMEENNEEEENGDDDEYVDNPSVRKLEPAVRN